jgi:hypothetical protein
VILRNLVHTDLYLGLTLGAVDLVDANH